MPVARLLPWRPASHRTRAAPRTYPWPHMRCRRTGRRLRPEQRADRPIGVLEADAAWPRRGDCMDAPVHTRPAISLIAEGLGPHGSALYIGGSEGARDLGLLRQNGIT